jgi:hypothetical protein
MGHSNSVITLKTYADWMRKADARTFIALLDDKKTAAA